MRLIPLMLLMLSSAAGQTPVIGTQSGVSIPAGVTEGVAIGDGAGANFPAGSQNIIAIGQGAGRAVTPANGMSFEIIAIGHNAGSHMDGAINNVAIGASALTGGSTVMSGIDNVAIGGSAGSITFYQNHTGSQNTWVGGQSGPFTTDQLSNTVAVGFQAHVTANDTAQIGNTSVTRGFVGPYPMGLQVPVPTTATSPCVMGQFSDTPGFHYACVATNTWQRAAMSTF